jgi:hypothetical protein
MHHIKMFWPMMDHMCSAFPGDCRSAEKISPSDPFNYLFFMVLKCGIMRMSDKSFKMNLKIAV